MTLRTRAIIGPFVYVGGVILIAVGVLWFISSPSALLAADQLDSATNAAEGFAGGAAWMLVTLVMFYVFFVVARALLRWGMDVLELPTTPAEARLVLEDDQ